MGYTFLFLFFFILIIFFQFPLWDTGFLGFLDMSYSKYFQFPLWDTLPYREEEKDRLYDYTFNSLYGIHPSLKFSILYLGLSIPFMGYKVAKHLKKHLPTVLSIPFMGYSTRFVDSQGNPVTLSIPFMGYIR